MLNLTLVLNLNKVSPNFHCRCGKKYKHRSSLSRHKKLCTDEDNSDILIKNTISSSHKTYQEPIFDRQTFITKIGVYDENRNLIAVADVATPVKKHEDNEYTFKLKLDI